ncbi:MAG: hypothetical protein KGL44_01695 [Sphingomonadales bacterium]|nr:hypothetical protein [Sphingomonadales bacterium]
MNAYTTDFTINSVSTSFARRDQFRSKARRKGPPSVLSPDELRRIVLELLG